MKILFVLVCNWVRTLLIFVFLLVRSGSLQPSLTDGFLFVRELSLAAHVFGLPRDVSHGLGASLFF